MRGVAGVLGVAGRAGRGAETAAVLSPAGAEGADEGTPPRLRRAVPAGAGGLLHPVGGVFQVAPGRLQPDLVDVAAWRYAHLGREGPGELPRGQAGRPGH